MNEKEKSVLFGLVLGVLLVLLLVTANISQLSSGKTEVLGAKPKYQDEIAYWDEFLAKHPNYLDGWIELARLEHERGNSFVSIQYLHRAREINPNSEAILVLKEKFGI